MATKPKRTHDSDRREERLPFDEALRRLVNAPPQHRPAKKAPKGKKPAEKK